MTTPKQPSVSGAVETSQQGQFKDSSMETTSEETQDTRQYLTDSRGKRTHVLLTIEEYETLLENAWHRQVIAERRTDDAEYLSLDEVKARLGLP